MSQLLTNLINFAKKYHYTTEEKPEKYTEWLTTFYKNGNWYINTSPFDSFVIIQNRLIVDKRKYNYKLENKHLYVENNDANKYKIENNHLYYQEE